MSIGTWLQNLNVSCTVFSQVIGSQCLVCCRLVVFFVWEWFSNT